MVLPKININQLVERGLLSDFSCERPDFVDPNDIQASYYERVEARFLGEHIEGSWDIRKVGQINPFRTYLEKRVVLNGKSREQLRHEALEDAIRVHFEASSHHRQIQILASLARMA